MNQKEISELNTIKLEIKNLQKYFVEQLKILNNKLDAMNKYYADVLSKEKQNKVK